MTITSEVIKLGIIAGVCVKLGEGLADLLWNFALLPALDNFERGVRARAMKGGQ